MDNSKNLTPTVYTDGPLVIFVMQFWRIKDTFDFNEQLDSIAPNRMNPTARRLRNQFEFFSQNFRTEVSTLSMDSSITARQWVTIFPKIFYEAVDSSVYAQEELIIV